MEYVPPGSIVSAEFVCVCLCVYGGGNMRMGVM